MRIYSKWRFMFLWAKWAQQALDFEPGTHFLDWITQLFGEEGGLGAVRIERYYNFMTYAGRWTPQIPELPAMDRQHLAVCFL